MDKLYFPNGVVISPENDFIVVAETFKSKLTKYWIKGEKKGTHEDFFVGLPGSPDNLSADKKGILVALASVIDEKHPSLPHKLSNYPLIRKFGARFIELILMPFRFINSYYPNPLSNYVAINLGKTEMFQPLLPKHRMVIRLDWNGNIVKSYHGTDDTLGMITHALEVGDYLYLGSVISKFIGRVSLNDTN